MSGDVYVPRRLAERGVEIAVPIAEREVWKKWMESDPALPKNYAELSRLTDSFVQPSGRRAHVHAAVEHRGSTPFLESCGEALSTRFFAGLGNPDLTHAERATLDAALAEAMPADWRTKSTDHFLLRWTESDPDPAHNFDPALIDEAGTLLEVAWQRLESSFGRAPLALPGGFIQVDFMSLGGELEGQTTPQGPIQFDASKWQDPMRSALRAPLAAHELFHRLQYAFDFRVTWAETARDVDWFSEGTARWAEVFVHQRLTASEWLTGWMSFPNLDFLAMGSFALPFWIFFDVRLRPANALLELLERSQNRKDAREGLDATLVQQTLPEFFALFATEVWLQEQTFQGQILGPNGQPIMFRPAEISQALGAGELFQSPEAIELGAFSVCYHFFTFKPEIDGRPLRIEAHAGDDLTYQVLSLRGVQKVDATSAISRDFVLEQTVQLAAADTLVLIASGRGAPTQLEVSAQVG